MEQLALLHRVSGIVSSSMSLEKMLEELVGLIVSVTSCDACLVYLLEESAGEIVLCASQLPHATEIGRIRMKIGEGVAGWVAKNHSVVALSSNASADPRFKAFSSLPEDEYEAFLSVPLISGGVATGVINIHHKKRREHAREEVALAGYVAEQMGGAISKARLKDENARLLAELESRKMIERAKGILQQRHGLSEEDAYLHLRSESRRLRRPMKDLAEAVILAEELHRKSGKKNDGQNTL